MPNKITISELNRLVRLSVEGAFPGGVWVVGEVRQFKIHSSGHWYFVLRDREAQVDCVMWRGDNAKVNWEIIDGIEVEAQVMPTIYEKVGRYQVVVKKIVPGGKGARAIAFEMLKKKLLALGLFDEAHKKKLPVFPLRIGVATSKTGAAIRDIMNVLSRRAPWITIILRDTKVQGDDAPQDIVSAIEEFNRFGEVDLLIVGRGGGSEEDLWCFNDEAVAYAIYNSEIPIISAVGHEIDFTIADFVADARAPTPSAAAEIAAPDKTELEHKLKNLLKTAANHLFRKNLQKRTNLQQFTQKLASLNPIHRINELRQKTDWIFSSILQKITQNIASRKQRVDNLQNALEMLSPQRVLARGFSIVRKDGRVIANSSNLAQNDSITIEFFKGSATATVEKTEGDRN